VKQVYSGFDLPSKVLHFIPFLKILSKRSVIVCLQYIFVLILAANINLTELGSYYGILSVCIVPLSLFSTLPEYLFSVNIAENNIRRNTLVTFSCVSLLVIISIFLFGLFINNLAIMAVSYLLAIYVSQLTRNYINAFKFIDKVMNNQILEQIFKLIFLYITILSFSLNIYSLFTIQLFAILISTGYLLLKLQKNGSNLYRHSNISFSITAKDIFNVTFSSFINISFVNSLKIFLNTTGQYNLLALIGLVQQVFGVLAANINAILQIQYGNLILLNRKYYVKSFQPTLLLLCISIVGIVFISYFFRFALPLPIQETGLLVFISIFFMECYIIPLSYLSKLYTTLKNTKKIIQMHIIGLALPLIIATTTGYFINEKAFLWLLMTRSGVTFIQYFFKYWKMNSEHKT